MRAGRVAMAVSLVAAGCGHGAPSDPGTSATLRIPGAQFYPESMPEPSGGPAVESARVPLADVSPGTTANALDGAMEASATSALVGLEGDSGYWVLVASAPDVAAPGFPTFHGELAYSAALPLGEHRLRVQGVDSASAVGEPAFVELHALPAGLPEGRLVIALSWDTESDLDLRVVTPDNVEIFARNVNSFEEPPAGAPTDPHAFEDGGILDFDSNQDCVIDGRRRENVVWTKTPPSGRYRVRVDTFSLCAATAARWEVVAVLGHRVLAHARGQSGPDDAAASHDRGAGTLAATFDVP